MRHSESGGSIKRLGMESRFSSPKSLAERLEGGELVSFEPCPFPLPSSAERAFLFDQKLHSAKKNISFNPSTERVTGFAYASDDQEGRLTAIMKAFALAAEGWLAEVLPRYAASWRPDRASFRPEEEATRKLRLTARNDLMHIDAFPSRPSQGSRILRLYVNIHPTDARVWATSDTFDKLIIQYGSLVGLPNLFSEGWATRFGQGLLSIFQPGSSERTIYDRFMLRFHHFLKANDQFQERAATVLAVRAGNGLAGFHRFAQPRRSAGPVRPRAFVFCRPHVTGAA